MLQHNFPFQLCYLATKTSWLIARSQWEDLENDHNSSLSLKPSNLELLVNQFNNATPENSNEPEKSSTSKYYDIEEIHNIEIPHKNKLLSLFHINVCSFNKNFNDLQHLLSCTKTKFDIIAISETRITKQVSLLNNLNLNILLNLLQLRLLQAVPLFTLLIMSYKCCNDLNIYKKNEVESTFIESINPKKIKYYSGSHLRTSIYGSY